MSMLAGFRLKVRAFLEGMEIPCIAAYVQINPNSPATCSLQIVPTGAALNLKPRTLVHVFYLDSYLNPDAPTSSNGSLDDYKLFFAGDLAGIAYAKTPSGRQCVLQCVDHSSYWDTTYQFFMNYATNSIFNPTTAAFAGGSMFNNITAGHMHVANQYLHSSPKTPGLKGVGGLLGGVIALLEAMGGVPNHYRGVNDFFTIAELKNHILQQIAAEQNDDTAKRIFDGKAFWDWLMRGMTGMGSICTFRDMLKMIFKNIYYDVIPNPMAKFVPGQEQTTKTVAVNVVWPSASERQTIQKWKTYAGKINGSMSAEALDRTISEAEHLKNDMNSILSSRGGSLSRRISSTISRISNEAHYLTVETGGAPLKDGEPRIVNRWGTISRAFSDLINMSHILFRTSKKVIDKKGELPFLNTQIFRPECFFVAPPRCNVLFPEQYNQFSYNRNFLQEPTRLFMTKGSLFVGTLGGLLPQITLAPSRAEIKKVAKEQGNNGLRSLMPWEIYSGILPKFESLSELNYAAARSERSFGFRSSGLKGPAAAYAQRAANFNFLRHRLAPRTATVSASFSPQIVCGFPLLLIDRGFIPTPEDIKTAIEEYGTSLPGGQIKFDEPLPHIREIAEAADAPTHFLGNVAAINHAISQEGAVTNLTLTHLRTHRIKDDDFLFGLSTEKAKDLATFVKKTKLNADSALRKLDNSGVELRRLIALTPQDMSIADFEVPDVTTNSASAGVALSTRRSATRDITGNQVPSVGSLASISSLEVITSDSTSILKVGDYLVPLKGKVRKTEFFITGDPILEPLRVGKSFAPGNVGPHGGVIKQIILGSQDLLAVDGKAVDPNLPEGKKVFLWRDVTIYEEVKSTRTIRKTVPIEEAMRPPWFTPLYSNWLIGDDIYQPFFGTGSIVDQAAFQFSDGISVFGLDPEAQQDIRERIKAANGDLKEINEILEEASPGQLANVPDITTAADALAFIYGKVKQNGLDVHRFVQDYVRRPIATMKDIFGDEGLSYTVTGNKITGVTGTPGFHSRAILPYGDLIGLLDNPDQKLPTLVQKGKRASISRALDPRPGRREAVQEYIDSLESQTGSLAIGLEG